MSVLLPRQRMALTVWWILLALACLLTVGATVYAAVAGLMTARDWSLLPVDIAWIGLVAWGTYAAGQGSRFAQWFLVVLAFVRGVLAGLAVLASLLLVGLLGTLGIVVLGVNVVMLALSIMALMIWPGPRTDLPVRPDHADEVQDAVSRPVAGHSFGIRANAPPLDGPWSR